MVLELDVFGVCLFGFRLNVFFRIFRVLGL